MEGILLTVELNGVPYKTVLNESQCKTVKSKYKPASYIFADGVFGKDVMRLTFDIGVKSSDSENKTDDELFGSNDDYISVKDFLKKHSYIIKDYGKGICVTDMDQREFKIGRILNRFNADPEVKRNFENGISRENAKNSLTPMKITISRNPYDVAAMSTARGWSSCMSLSDGCNSHYVYKDVAKGTCIAYLHSADDPDIENPTSRILLKKFKKNNSRKRVDHVLIPESRSYGATVREFVDFVQKWAEDSFPLNEDCILKFQEDLYNDGVGRDRHYVSINSPKITSDNDDDKIYACKYGSDSVREKILNQETVSDNVYNAVATHSKDKNIIVQAIMKLKDCKKAVADKISYFNVMIKNQADVVKSVFQNNTDREYARPIIKHFEKTDSGIEFYISEYFDNMSEVICRHGNDNLVRAFLKKYPTTFNKIEVGRRVPRQLTSEIMEGIINDVGIVGAFIIIKNDCLGSVNYKIDDKSVVDFIEDKFPDITKLLKKYNNTDINTLMELVKNSGEELNEKEFFLKIKK